MAEIEAAESHDPLLYTAGRLIDEGLCTSDEVLNIYEHTEARVARVAEDAITRPRLKTAAQVMDSIIPPPRAVTAVSPPSLDARQQVFGATDMRALGEPQHMARLINFALTVFSRII